MGLNRGLKAVLRWFKIFVEAMSDHSVFHSKTESQLGARHANAAPILCQCYFSQRRRMENRQITPINGAE
jgi:hypothetical protein